MEKFKFTIDEDYDGIRLDKTISDLTGPLISRSFLQKLIKDGAVFVNGSPKKASYNVKCEDEIVFEVPDASECNIVAENIPLDILYEDSDVIVINKPKGMVVHPANGHYTGTLVNALLYHCKDSLSGINGVMRPGIVHRIDMNTTGSIIACKNDAAHLSIAAQLKEHSINRTYRAICYGTFDETEITVNAPIGRSTSDRKKMAVTDSGKKAVTHIKVIEEFKDFSYIECKLETGRTHQIRVHLAHIGHPLLGDDVYSNRKTKYKTNGQCLHAYKLGFMHPATGEYVESIAPIPSYLNDLLIEFRAGFW